LLNSDDNDVINNKLINNTSVGIRLENAHINMISGNTIKESDQGIQIYYSNGSKVINNNISYNDDYGVLCVTSSNNEFVSNNISYNDQYGLRFFMSCYDNIIWSNYSISNNVNTDVMGIPTIDDPTDYQYEFGTTGHNITWSPNVRDTTPSSYEITRNGVVINNTAWSGTDISVIIDGLSVGTYIYTCTAYETNGNGARDSVAITVVDTIIPTIDDQGDVIYEHGTIGHNITWSPSDSNPDYYVITIDGVDGPSTSWDGNDITIFTDGLPTGTFTYICTVYDGGGNNATDTVTITVEDTIAPTIDDQGDAIYEHGTIGHNITWSPSDSNPDYYVITIDGVDRPSTSWDGNDITIFTDGLPTGIYTYACTVYDGGGNNATDTVTITVEDTIAPTIDDQGDVIYEHGTTGHNIRWSPSDSNPDYYVITIDGDDSPSMFWDGNDIMIFTDGLSTGTYIYTCTVYDGVSLSASDTVQILVEDTLAPTIDEPEDNEYHYGTTGQNITWAPRDSNPDYYIVTRNGDIIANETWDGSNITVNVDGLFIGNHTYVCIVFDGAGHNTSDTVYIMVYNNPIQELPIENYFILIICGALISIVIIRKLTPSPKKNLV